MLEKEFSEEFILSLAINTHKAVSLILLSDDFIRAHGIYTINNRWLVHWLKTAKGLNGDTSVGQLGYSLYASRLRHDSAKRAIQPAFQKIFRLKQADFEMGLKNVASTVGDGVPYVLTCNVLSVWQQLAWALHADQPILLTGMHCA